MFSGYLFQGGWKDFSHASLALKPPYVSTLRLSPACPFGAESVPKSVVAAQQSGRFAG